MKHPTVPKRPAQIVLALALSFSPVIHAQSGSAEPGAPVPFAIDAKPLAQALADWSLQSRIALSVPPGLVAGKTAPAVSGSLAPRQALDRLLAGSGLAAFTQGAGVTVRQAAPTAAVTESTLPSIRATAAPQSSPLGYLAKDTTTGAFGDKAVLDTPFSVTVVGSDEILTRGARSIGQVFVNDPSVFTPTSSISTDWWGTQIRGLGVRNNYVDEVPMLLYWGGDFPLEVTESVTALKGLTGFMYGFGEPGGALSYTLKRPTRTPETSVTVGYRNPRLFSAHVDTSQNLSEDLAVRANLATEQGTAYNESELDRKVASLAIDKRFGSALKWTTTLMYEDSRTEGEPLQFYFTSYDVAGSGGALPKVTYDYGDFNVDNSYYETETLLASTALQWQLDDDWSLKYQLGFSRKKHRSNKAFADLLSRDGDYRGTMYNFAGQLDNLFNQVMVQGTVATGPLKHELVGGVALQRSLDRWSDEFYWSNDFNGNLYDPQPFRTTRNPDFTLQPVSADTRQASAFLSDTVHFNQRWQAILGLRFTHYDTKDLDGDPAVDSRYKTSKTSPTLALIYKPDDETSVYGSYVEGLEAGQRVGPTYTNAGDLLGATVSKQYEVGVKHVAGDLDYSAALFRIERANQMEEIRGTDRYLTQDGLVIYQGLETTGAYQFTRNLNVGLGAIYLDAAIDKVSAANAGLKGKAPSNSPKWQVVANTQYKVPGVAGLELQGNVRYFGKTYVSDDNTLRVPGRAVANAGLSYDFRVSDQNWTLYANVFNLFNKKYWANGGWGSGNAGEARNLSVALRARF